VIPAHLTGLLWDHVEEIARQVVWATLSTVDADGRPWSRIVHPVWEGTTVWVTSRGSELVRSHLAANPWASVSWWSGAQDTVTATCRASWEDDGAERRRVWAHIASLPPPYGFDPATVFRGSLDDSYLMRLQAWRVRVGLASRIAAGQPHLVWEAADA
jgi:hypothetical protein